MIQVMILELTNSLLLERSMKFLAKSKRPIFLSWSILGCSRSTSRSFLLQSTFQGHGVELRLLCRDFLNSGRVKHLIWMRRSESIHAVIFIFDVGILVCKIKQEIRSLSNQIYWMSFFWSTKKAAWKITHDVEFLLKKELKNFKKAFFTIFIIYN